jgi:hypothetical protein
MDGSLQKRELWKKKCDKTYHDRLLAVKAKFVVEFVIDRPYNGGSNDDVRLGTGDWGLGTRD